MCLLDASLRVLGHRLAGQLCPLTCLGILESPSVANKPRIHGALKEYIRVEITATDKSCCKELKLIFDHDYKSTLNVRERLCNVSFKGRDHI